MSQSIEAREEPVALLLKEAERQIRFLSSNRPRQLLSSSEILHIESKDEDPYFFRTLVLFRAFISECIADGRALDGDILWEPPPRQPTSLYGSFWGKFLYPARPSAQFIHPTRMKEKLDALRNVSERSLPDEDAACTYDVWADDRVREWTASAKPSHLYLHEPPRRSSRLQKFGIELVQHLQRFIPVIYLLGGKGTFLNLSQCSLTPASVIEQLVYQAIFHLPNKIPLSRLAFILSSLKGATEVDDWFEMLEFVCSHVDTPRIAVVVEIKDIPTDMIEDVKRWPSEFENMSNRLNGKSGIQLQTMLLWPRYRLDGPSCGTSSGQVVEIRDGSRFGFTTSRLLRSRLARPIPLLASPASSSDTTPPLQTNTSKKTTLPTSIESSSPTLTPSSTHQIPPPPMPTSLPTPLEVSGKIASHRQDTTEHVEMSKTRQHIKLAIVCALTLEADAVHALFDDYWDDLEPDDMRSPGDTNSYSFGTFGKFPTVLVHMPGMGKMNASTVAANCHISFPNVKLALVVGICGGVPFYGNGNTEIVLGDVVISEGLVPYDYGRQFPDCFLRKTSASEVLGRPPTVLRGLLNKLKGRRGRQRLQERTVSHLQTLRSELGIEVDYLGPVQDHLFQGNYMHRHRNRDICGLCSGSAICDAARSSTCEELLCDQDKLLIRERLQAISRDGVEFAPVVHFGYIACGDQIMKSGEHRDSIAKEEGVIAFEMEGAGVWDMFPCLVIKGVCDYADSHKQKKWQTYAAGTAAACTKAVIQEWHM